MPTPDETLVQALEEETERVRVRLHQLVASVEDVKRLISLGSDLTAAAHTRTRASANATLAG